MKKTLLPVILLILVFCLAGCQAKITSTPAVSEGSDYDVLYFNWGMSTDEIAAIEKREPDENWTDAYGYDHKELNGLPCSLVYSFEENELSYFACYFDESCATSDNFKAVKSYIEKYVSNLSEETSVDEANGQMISWVNDRSKINLYRTNNFDGTYSLTLDAFRL